MYEQNEWKQLSLPTLATLNERLDRVAAARKEIESVLAENPNALCPSPVTLMEIEETGATWNFETGQIEPAPSQAEAGTVKIPIVGTLSKEGIKVWRSAE